MFHLLGASGRETKDQPGGGGGKRTACSHGKRVGQHAGQSTGQLPGTPEHANESEDFLYVSTFVFLCQLPWHACVKCKIRNLNHLRT